MKRYFLLVLVFMMTLPGTMSVLADNLKQAVEIAAHGSKFQAERLKIAAENLANQDSTGATPGTDPYKRKVIFPENKYDKKLKTNVIRTKRVDVDNSEFILKYDPYHPAADAEGMVKYPNVTREIERADASEAQRSYEANLSVIEVTNSLMQKTVEAIGRQFMPIDSIGLLAQQSYSQIQDRPKVEFAEESVSRAASFHKMVDTQFNSFAKMTPTQILSHIQSAKNSVEISYVAGSSGVMAGATKALRSAVARQENVARKSLVGQAFN